MGKKKPSKQRTDFRKRHQGRVRDSDFTRDYRDGNDDRLADAKKGERVSGKGDLTRKRTISEKSDDDPTRGQEHATRTGRVLSAHGLKCKVLSSDGETVHCVIRQVLKSLNIDGRSPVVAGDRVRFRSDSAIDGMIESVETREGVICRSSRGQQHVLAANVDQLLIITSVANPSIKPVLIDRFLLMAFQCDIQPILVLNKMDLINPAEFQQLIGVYCAMGVRVLMTSAETEQGVDFLRTLLTGRQTALAGQSGVGKSSLLNVVQPGLGLAIGRISNDNQKGRHTTTATTLIPLDCGGAVFDTPGIRQFKLWDIDAAEVAGLMPDLRPYVSHCRYPDCLHLSEDDCMVKEAVADGRIDARRYDSYCHLLESDLLLDD